MRKILAAITVLFGLCGLASAQPAGMVFGPGTTPCAYTTCKATSLALGGATIGPDALGVAGTSTLGGAVTVSSGNLSVSSGGVTANSFTAGSTGLFVFGSRGILSSSAAGTLQFGNADVDTAPVAQTLRTQGTLAGGTSNVAGANWTFIASPGKGTGAGGSFIFQTTPAGSTGTVVGTPTTVLTLLPTTQAQFAAGGPTAPSIVSNTDQTGFYFTSNTIRFAAGGSNIVSMSSSILASSVSASSWGLNTAGASSTVPTLSPNKADTTTGIGAQASGNMSMIVGGAEQGRWTSTGLNNTNIGATTAGTGAFTNIGIGLAINTGFALTSSIATGKTSYSSVVGAAGNWQMGQNAGACGGDDTFGWYSSTAAKYLFCMDSTGPAIRINAPITFIGTAPTPTGTGSPVMATGSTDSAGEVTGGTSATSIVVTFATAKTNAPFCTVTPQTQLLAFAYTISTAAITITQTATTGEKIDYICTQH